MKMFLKNDTKKKTSEKGAVAYRDTCRQLPSQLMVGVSKMPGLDITTSMMMLDSQQFAVSLASDEYAVVQSFMSRASILLGVFIERQTMETALRW